MNLHDDDLKRLVGLKYSKEMWDKLESIFGDGTSSNMENDKKSNKKKNKKKTKKKGHRKLKLIHKSLILLVKMIQLMIRRNQKILNPKV